MTAPEFDPALVEQAARALHVHVCGTAYDEFENPCSWTEEGEVCHDVNLSGVARAVLTAAAPDLRAEGRRQALLDVANDVGARRALLTTEYQRGMVEGARQVAEQIVKTPKQIQYAMNHARRTGDLVGKILSACLADEVRREPLDRKVVAEAAHDAAEAASRAFLNAREAQRQATAAREAVARIEGGEDRG